ncbi:MAG: hypothetical protein ABI910_21335 [Gemmatimonadota bacterium]
MVCLALGMLGAAAALAQTPGRYRLAVGAFEQSTAGVADRGWTVAAHRAFSLSEVLALEFGLDLAHVSAPAKVGFCEVVANNWCVGEGGPQTLLAPQLGMRLHGKSTQSLRPYLAVGGATLLSLDDPTSSARPTLTVPQISVGVAKSRWMLEVRLRGLREWQYNPYRQVALQLGTAW